ncbi:GntR family transcriptional regulator [Methylobacterium dankookense]|uniref:HTH-type transcriptional repressor RspR n=1 Tax=Methylobacterium dankookense TaxID=560405 RepID=A0A564G5L7_9HYPH|nr:GntR family transcriptional regulator [Methylobacterium dankookense]GJD56528.1 HTH-type transcriptional repressor RspR [Methylobacterium dankookense]VUF15324.1 HTH-type transcriptional repressor RspR [Methylobacterium dankookense]
MEERETGAAEMPQAGIVLGARGLPLSRRIPFARQVADTLRDLIVRGELAAGSRVVERVLCERLNVSRTPMREALKLLEADGLIEISQNRGARVMSLTSAEARHLFEVIAELEGLAAGRAVLTADAAALAGLEDLHAQMLRHFEAREKDPYFELNSRIHDLVVKLSDNPVLIGSHATLMLRARRGRYVAIFDPARWAESVGEHEALMEAFRGRDPERARTVWRQHLCRTGETVADGLDQAGGPTRSTAW